MKKIDAEDTVAIKYYNAEIYKEIFGEEGRNE